jgi:excisionase family DNA binding protein
MNEEIEKLKLVVKEQQVHISQLQKRSTLQPLSEPVIDRKEDELLDLQQVKKILNIGRNSLLKLVKEGVFKAIKLNRRTVRYSRQAIMDYIERIRTIQA